MRTTARTASCRRASIRPCATPLGITTRAAQEDAPAGEALERRLAVLTEQMQQAARELEFEQAARLRDEIRRLTGEDGGRPAAGLRPGMIGAHKRARGRTRK